MANTIDQRGDEVVFKQIVERTISEFMDDGLSIIGTRAFQRCSSLYEVSLPAVTTIGSMAFAECSSLTSVNLPLVTTIGKHAFGYCSSLTSVNLPLVTTIGEHAFGYCSSLTSVSLPLATTIAESGFAYCGSLTTVSLPLIKNLGTRAFVNCTSLSQVYILASSVCFQNTTAFASTPIAYSSYLGYFGSIYVPESLVSAYKSAVNWSGYADRITAYTE